MTNIKRITAQELTQIIHDKLKEEIPDLCFINVGGNFDVRVENGKVVNVQIRYLDVEYRRESDGT